MRTCLTIIGILLSILSFGQKRMSLNLHITPLYSYRSINTTNSVWNGIFLNDLDRVEQPDFGLSFGISVEKQVLKRLQVMIGIDRTVLSEKITRYFSHPSIGTYSKDFYNDYEYNGISLATTYNTISNSHWDMGFMLSLRLDRLMRYDIEPYSLRKDNSLSVWIYDKFAIGSSVGMNLEYRMKSFSIYTTPGYFRYLTPNAHYNYSDNSNLFPTPISTEIRQHNFYFFTTFGIKYVINNPHRPRL